MRTRQTIEVVQVNLKKTLDMKVKKWMFKARYLVYDSRCF